MAKKLAVILISLFVLSAIIIAVFYINRQTKFVATSAMNAVPVNSALIIESYHFQDLISGIRDGNLMYNELLNISLVKKIDKQLGYIDSLLKTDKRSMNFITGNSVIAAAVLTGKNKFDYLYLFSFAGNSQYEGAKDLVKELLQNRAVITERNYNKTDVYDARLINAKDIFSYAFSNGVFMMSYSSILVEEAILHLSSENPLTKNAEFSKIAATAGKNTRANIYINHRTFPQLMSLFTGEEYKHSLQTLSGYANWSELDVTLHPDELLLNGFTYTNDSDFNYLNIFLDQTPGRSNVESVLPANTSTFACFCISNYKEFKKDYRNYLEQQGNIQNYKSCIDDINMAYDIDIEKMFSIFFDSELALAYTDLSVSTVSENTFAIILAKSESVAKDELFRILERYAQQRRSNIQALTYNYRIDKETSHPIYQMPVEYLMKKMFGLIFSEASTRFFTFIGNYLVFGNSVKALSGFIHENVLQKTLKNDLSYNTFSGNFCSKSNFYLYSSIPQSISLYNNFLNDELKKNLKINLEIFKKFQALAFQFRSNNKKGMIYNDLIFTYNPVIKEKPRTVWESRLDTTINFKPKLLQNPESGEKEIMVQDMGDKLYLINNIGRIIWKKQLSESLNSDIYQVDYYRNGKLQYLFSTKKAIYLVDRDGNDVERYPVRLASDATNGVAVFDYDKNRDYRLFIACEDRRIHAFSKEGKLIDGWEFGRTENRVTSEVQHFRAGGKDYIVIADKYKIYILDRKGQQRVSLSSNFPKSLRNSFIFDNLSPEPRIVTTDTTGKVYFVYFSGKVESKSAGNFSSGHFFDYQDVDSDDSRDFIFADKNKLIVIGKRKKLFDYEFRENIDDRPAFYQFSNRSGKIGVVSKDADEIFLFNSDGSLYKGFPLTGRTMFSIGIISDSNRFNLFVGSNDKFLYNYEIQ